jgi:hypothetical protein
LGKISAETSKSMIGFKQLSGSCLFDHWVLAKINTFTITGNFFTGDKLFFINGKFFSIQDLYFLVLTNFPRPMGEYISLQLKGLPMVQLLLILLLYLIGNIKATL